MSARFYVFYLFLTTSFLTFGGESLDQLQDPSAGQSTSSDGGNISNPPAPQTESEASLDPAKAQQTACQTQYANNEAYKALAINIKQLGEQERALLQQINTLLKSQGHTCADQECAILVGSAMESGLKAGIQMLQQKLDSLQGNSQAA